MNKSARRYVFWIVQSVKHDKFSGLRTDFGVKTYIELLFM